MSIDQTLKAKYAEKVYQIVQAISPFLSIEQYENQFQDFRPASCTNKLRIAYVLNHVRVCGGVKIILEHANQLTERDHEVFLICRDPQPDWMTVRASYIQAKLQEGFVPSIPEVDIIICTVIDQVPECYLLGKAPVVLFEQGDTYIYEFDKLQKEHQEYFRNIWRVPVPVFGVSKILVETLTKQFGRRGFILHNALNKSCFYPKQTLRSLPSSPKIIFVGQEHNTFKGIAVIRQALQKVKEAGYQFEEVWVTQTPPESEFFGKLIINPSQEQLGEAYRMSDIFVSGSYYESFPLPPLEAMACGCAVVSTSNEGVKEYAVDGENCLLGDIGDASSLAKRIMQLLDNDHLRAQLIKKGYETASQFDWKSIMGQWEQYLQGAIELWNTHEQALGVSVRMETLSRGLSHSEAVDHIRSIQSSMKEDWCLWLVEGETIKEDAICYIKHLLKQKVRVSYGIQVAYENDMPGHTVVRVEKRLLQKHESFSENVEQLIVLPIKIDRGTELYFSPQWITTVKGYYVRRNFQQLISFVQKHFPHFSQREQLVSLKWVVLSLVEIDQYENALQVLQDAYRVDASYSDLLYLGARLSLMLEHYEEAKQLLELARFSGTSLFHGDAILHMEELCEELLAKYNL